MSQEISASITALRAPLVQLLGNANKAEKSLKSAVDQSKKLAEKKQAAASKGKKANPTTALFDQGCSAACQLERVATGAKVDVSKPFSLDGSSLVSAFMQDGTQSKEMVNAFEASFDENRKTNKGIRVSKALEGGEQKVKDLVQSLVDVFAASGGLPASGTMDGKLQGAIVPSLFGIDASYDKASAESYGLATLRLTVSGSRTLVLTEMMQLHGFMERKGIAAPIAIPKMSTFFKGMNAGMLAEYAKECTLWSSCSAFSP